MSSIADDDGDVSDRVGGEGEGAERVGRGATTGRAGGGATGREGEGAERVGRGATTGRAEGAAARERDVIGGEGDSAGASGDGADTAGGSGAGAARCRRGAVRPSAEAARGRSPGGSRMPAVAGVSDSGAGAARCLRRTGGGEEDFVVTDGLTLVWAGVGVGVSAPSVMMVPSG
ncbi:hypothetical protein [Actinomyces israelii]